MQFAHTVNTFLRFEKYRDRFFTSDGRSNIKTKGERKHGPQTPLCDPFSKFGLSSILLNMGITVQLYLPSFGSKVDDLVQKIKKTSGPPQSRGQ